MRAIRDMHGRQVRRRLVNDSLVQMMSWSLAPLHVPLPHSMPASPQRLHLQRVLKLTPVLLPQSFYTLWDYCSFMLLRIATATHKCLKS